MEAVFYESEIEALDAIKRRFRLSSRSEVLRLLLAKTDLSTLTPADVAAIQKDAA